VLFTLLQQQQWNVVWAGCPFATLQLRFRSAVRVQAGESL
jgi:hypothetical protein